MNNNTLWSTWLLPCKTDARIYKTLISDYSEIYSSKKFEPHVTLFGRLSIDPATTFSFFKNLAASLEPFDCSLIGTAKGKPPWMLYYIMVEKNETIGLLQNKIDILLSGYCLYEFIPHLSLVYGNAQIEDENGDSILAGEKIRFSSIALVRTPDEVANWEIIKTFDFSN